MAADVPFAPHETRMLALEMAVDFVNGDARKSTLYTTEDVLKIATDFEAWLTAAPVAGFEADAENELDDP